MKEKNSLLGKWKNRTASVEPPIIKAPTAETYPLGGAQQRLWLLQELNPGNPFYNYCELLTVRQAVDVELLLQAYSVVVAEEPIFNVAIRNDDGVLNFVPSTTKPAKPTIVNEVDDPLKLAHEKGTESFDLENGPLLDCTIAITREQHTAVILTMHHIITDKWSMRIFRKRWFAAYHALSTGMAKPAPPAYSYFDYTYWEKDRKTKPETLQFWTEKLKGNSKSIILPKKDNQEGMPSTSHSGKHLSIKLGEEVIHQVGTLCKKYECTPYVFFLSCYYVLLQKYDVGEVINIGTAISSRSKSEFEEVIGFFNNSLVLQTTINSSDTIGDFIKQVKGQVLDAFKFADMPYAELVAELNPKRTDVAANPLFNSMFLYHKDEKEVYEGVGLVKVDVVDLGVAKFDLTLYVSEYAQHYDIIFEYNTDLLDDRLIARLGQQYTNVIQSCLAEQESTIANIDYLDEQSEKLTFPDGSDQSIQVQETVLDRFYTIVAQYPQSLATTDADGSMTYSELHRLSDQLAHTIAAETSSGSQMIAFMAERSTKSIVIILAILKSGHAYIPLDPNYPKERLQYIIEDADVQLVITTEVAHNLGAVATVINYDQAIKGKHHFDSKSVTPDSLAYVIHTSGSSGQPKGVMVSHQNLLSSTLARLSYYPQVPSSFLLLSSFSFDSSVAGIFWSLVTGGNLIISPHRLEQDIDLFSQYLIEHKVTHTLMIPRLYNALLHSSANHSPFLQSVILAGESIASETVRMHFHHYPDVKLYNEYGPTEASVWSTVYEIVKSDIGQPIPIGKACAHVSTYIVNEQLTPVPMGVVGQIAVGGMGVTKGYLGDVAKTAIKYVRSNFHGADRLYLTGDLARYDENENLIFLGRNDSQIKIRGYRVELSEVKAKIGKLVHSTFCEVLHVDDSLVLYHSDPSLDMSEVRAGLQKQLPVYMTPTAEVFVKQPAFLPNGKIDMKALEVLKPSSKLKPIGQEKPRTTLQVSLAGIWETVLVLDAVGLDDNYFSLGGDSIKSIRIVSLCRDAKIPVTAQLLFKNQTVRQLASAVEEISTKIEQPVLQATPEQLLPIQQWFLESDHHDLNHWNLAISFHLAPDVSIDTLISFIKAHHRKTDIYKINFNQQEGIWRWQYNERSVDELYQVISEGGNLASIHKSFELSTSALLQWVIVPTADRTRVHVIAHHIVIDIISFDLILQSLDNYLSSGSLPSESQSMFAQAAVFQNLLKQDFFAAEIPFWSQQRYRPISAAPVEKRCEKQYETRAFVIPKTHLQQSIDVARKSIGLNAMEYFLASFLKVVQAHLPESGLTVNIEESGRKPIDAGIDISLALGWFTSYYPVTIDISPSASFYSVATEVKKRLSSISNSGVGYGILKHNALLPDGVRYGDVAINYIPYLDTDQRFKEVTAVQYDIDGTRHQNNVREELLTINIFETQQAYSINVSLHTELSSTLSPMLISKWDTALRTPQINLRLEAPQKDGLDLSLVNADAADTAAFASYAKQMSGSVLTTSSNQKTLLYHHLAAQTDKGVIVSSTEVRGHIDYDILGEAIANVVDQHTPLRQTFVWKDISKPYAIVHDYCYIPVCIHDISHWYEAEQDNYVQELQKSENSRGLVLSQMPLLRINLIKLADEQHVLIKTSHHITLDGWSSMLFFKYVLQHYTSINRGTTLSLPITTIRDVINSKSQLNAQDVSFWQDYLRALPALPSSVPVTETTAIIKTVALNPELVVQLYELGKKQQVSIGTIITAAWSLIENRIQEQHDIIFGFSVLGRSSGTNDLQHKLGLYANIVPLRIQLNTLPTNAKIVKQVQETVFTLSEYESNALPDIVDRCNLPSNIFDSLLVINNYPKFDLEGEDLQFSNFNGGLTSIYPVTAVFMLADSIKLKLVVQEQHRDKDWFVNLSSIVQDTFSSLLVSDQKPVLAANVPKQLIESPSPKAALLQEHTPSELTSQLLLIWSEIFKSSNIKLSDNFFDLGGNSIAILQLFSRIDTVLQKKTPPTKLFEYPTVQGLADYLSSTYGTKSENSLIKLRTSGTKSPLFCFHAGDGHVLFYKNVADSIGPDYPVYAIQPGELLEGKKKYTDIKEMAIDYIATMKTVQPKGPYQLLATCFSNAVTFEMSKILQEQNEEISHLLIVDSGPPGHAIPRYPNTIRHKLINTLKAGNFARLAYLVKKKYKFLRYGLTTTVTEGFHSQEQQAAKENLNQLIEDYKWTPVAQKISLIRSREFSLEPDKDYHLILWDTLSKGQLQVDVVKSKHVRLFEQPEAKRLGNKITTLLGK